MKENMKIAGCLLLLLTVNVVASLYLIVIFIIALPFVIFIKAEHWVGLLAKYIKLK